MDIKDIMSLPHTTSIKPELATVRSAATPKARSASQDLDGQRPPKRSRKAINCDPCRASKLKCDRGRPCSGCVLRGTTAQCYPDSTSNEHSTPAHISSVDTVDLHTGDPYAEIARMRQSLAALEAQLARHGITPPGNSNSSLVPAASVSNGGGTNGHISPSQISSTPTNEGESTSSPPAMEAGMYVGPTSAASPLLSFRYMSQSNGVYEGGSVPTETSPDESGAASCSLDVRQNLDLLAKLPDVAIVDGLLKHYFENCTWLNRYLNQPSLQTSWTRFKVSTCTDHLTVSILFVVLAISLHYLPKSHPLAAQLNGANSLSEEYYENSTIALERQRANGPKVPTMELVELHLLRAGYLSIFKVDCEEIWTIRGEVMSIALSLGLHRDPGKWRLSREKIERRRWAWWNVLQLERWQAFLFGRPISIPNSQFDTMFPMEDVTDPAVGAASNPMLPYLHLFKLTLILGDVMTDATSCRPVSYDRILAHDNDLENWFKHLPHDFNVDDYRLASLLSSQSPASLRLGVQSLCIRALAYHIKFTLHRPFTTPQIRRDARTSASYDASIVAADKLIHLLTTSRPDFMSNPLLAVPGHISWGPFHLFAAAISFIFLLIWKPDQPGTAMFRSNIQRVVTALESLRVDIPIADQALRILQTLAPLYNDGSMRKVDEKQRDNCMSLVRRLAFPCHDSRLASRSSTGDSPSQSWSASLSPPNTTTNRPLDSVPIPLQSNFGPQQFEPSPYPQNSSEEAMWSASLGLDGDAWNMFLYDNSAHQPTPEKILGLWESLSLDGLDTGDVRAAREVDEEEPPNSTVYDFRAKVDGSSLNGSNGVSPAAKDVVSKLKSLTHLSALLTSLGEQLLSNKSDDDLSNYLLDLVGMDEIDLVHEIMSHRRDVGSALMEEPADASSGAVVSKQKRYKPLDQELDDGRVGFTAEEAKLRIQESLRANEERPLYSGTGIADGPVYPHVYTSSSNTHGNILSMFGSKFALPVGTQRNTYEQYQEVIIPPANAVPPRLNERLIPVHELDVLARGCFPGYKSLNRIQSIVYPTAYTTNENMLVCAPTGAGKTDVAMLSILRVLDQHISSKANPQQLAAAIDTKAFKIIYVAPMKALAAEIVRKLGKRLQWLSIKVRELTGDMQLTKAEIDETQIIVTTPEKWDVVTRKPTGEGELASKIKLLIIDEIHLLNDERGAVIETIVARTLRQVESSQSVIRVVGLSATLPNFVDVAEFVGANRERGLFYFDSSFRPVPLEQHFLGIKGKSGSPTARKNLDEVTFEKVSELVREGHQVMVFVHARKETVKSALALREAANQDDCLDQFSCMDHPQFQFFRREIGASRNREMKQLFDDGFGIHHAGMLRSDRNMMERMFEARAIKVLCCTATLAWGVNLPAHAGKCFQSVFCFKHANQSVIVVIIKGTQVYDSNRGSFVDLSVLDVLQIFGRAGRPGMESSGVGYICTSEEKLEHYLSAMISQHPIESKLVSGIVDSLNAEIALGTVSNLQEAVSWLGYTYLIVRMRKNPTHYGITREMLQDDPQLGGRRMELAISAARKLTAAGMINYNAKTEELIINDLGLIAARYYIRHASIEVYNELFKPQMSESDLLVMLSKSTEFAQIQVRENELTELEAILKNEDLVPCQLPEPLKGDTANRRVGVGGDKPDGKGGDKAAGERKPSPVDTTDGKVNVLLQAYISRGIVQDFALVSDMAYVAQNGGRIIRALLEIAITRKYASTAVNLAQMSLAVEKRMWPFVNPMGQFADNLRRDVLHNLSMWADQYTPAELAQYNAKELGELIHMNHIHGGALLKNAKQFPSAELSVRVRPLTAELLRIQVKATRNFEWNKARHGRLEPFWLWVQDEEGNKILQYTRVAFLAPREQADQSSTGERGKENAPKGPGWMVGSSNVLRSEFMIPLRAVTGPTKSITVRLISDRWLGAFEEVSVSLQGVTFPGAGEPPTPVLNLPFLSLDVLSEKQLEMQLQARAIQTFNGMQTQAFYALVQTAQNVLLAGPTANGKSTLVLAALRKSCSQKSSPSVLVFVPRKQDAPQIVSSLRELGANASLAGAKNLQNSQPGRIHAITPFKFLEWVRESRQNLSRSAYIRGLGAVVFESLESLDAEYELAIALIRHATQTLPVRFVGVSSSLTDTSDIASWLAVPPRGNFSFQPGDREQELISSAQPFSIPHSAALLHAMAKPVYSALRTLLAEETGLVFVPAQGLCQNVVSDLVRLCGLDFNALGFLGNGLTPDDMETFIGRLGNQELADGLAHGVGVYHSRMNERDQRLVLELYAEGTVRVLVAPREVCWSIPVRAARVVVMGTQYMQFGTGGTDRELRSYTWGEVIRMQSRAVRPGLPGSFVLMCQGEDRETYMRFLSAGLPLESELMEGGCEVLKQWAKAMVEAQLLQSPQDLLDVLGHTYLRRRLRNNPNYYEDEMTGRDTLSNLVDLVWPKASS